MSKCKKPLLWLLLFSFVIASLLPLRARAEQVDPPPPSLSAQSAVLIEADSGKIVTAKSAHTPLPMASTTKIMTALCALELASPDTPITVDAAAVGIEGSSVYLSAGEVLTLEHLLYALLLESANDAAVAIALGLCGSVEDFAEQMNALAQKMGLEQTHFTNPHGLDDGEHFTTAYELALITREAMKNQLFAKIVATRKYTVPHPDAEGNRLLVNHNKLLRIYGDCVGVKTGFTKKSGRCLVSAAERDGVRLIAVTLNAPDDWNDHVKMLDFGFTRYRSALLCQAREFSLPLSLIGGAEPYVMVCNEDELRLTLPVDCPKVLKTVELRRFEFAPIKGGDQLGEVVFRCDLDGDGTAEVIGSAPLTARYAVDALPRRLSFWEWLLSLFGF